MMRSTARRMPLLLNACLCCVQIEKCMECRELHEASQADNSSEHGPGASCLDASELSGQGPGPVVVPAPEQCTPPARHRARGPGGKSCQCHWATRITGTPHLPETTGPSARPGGGRAPRAIRSAGCRPDWRVQLLDSDTAAARLTPSACPPTLQADLVCPPDPPARLGPASNSRAHRPAKREPHSQR